jgi:hypothetical protein
LSLDDFIDKYLRFGGAHIESVFVDLETADPLFEIDRRHHDLFDLFLFIFL